MTTETRASNEKLSHDLPLSARLKPSSMDRRYRSISLGTKRNGISAGMHRFGAVYDSGLVNGPSSSLTARWLPLTTGNRTGVAGIPVIADDDGTLAQVVTVLNGEKEDR
jgi:hypothetical protein